MFCKIIPVLALLLTMSCTSMQKSEPKKKEYDRRNRLTRVFYYNGEKLKFTENLSYIGKNTQPYRILYKSSMGQKLLPTKEINYNFNKGKVLKKTFYNYINNKKIREGFISYKFNKEKLILVKYYMRLRPSKKLFMFALQQLAYSDDNLKSKRIIHFKINPLNNKPMQNCQHIVNYKNGEINHMKSWILDMETKKIVEINNNSITLITKIVKQLDQEYTKKSSGNGFINI